VISHRPILFILGILIAAIGLAMVFSALADYAAGQRDWVVFATSSALSVFLGNLLVFMSMGPTIKISLRQGFLLTVLSWIALSAVGAMPLVFSELGLSYTDAFFETISGLTTTGSTVLAGLDHMPPGILLWRAMLQWIGGVGIIVMAIAMLPFLRVGGMQLFRMESSDRSEKALPRAAQVAAGTAVAYALITLTCALCYFFAGMTEFEAIVHAMTTVSTGGYSTSDSSLGHFPNPSIHWIATLFMLLGALPFVLYIRAAQGRPGTLFRDSQVRHFLCGLAVVILPMALWLWIDRGEPFLTALRLAAFNIVSVVTTTGFAIADYGQWGHTVAVVFFVLTFMGGCTGSTSGGVKVFRFELAFIAIRSQIYRMYTPHGVVPIHYQGRTLPEDVVISAMTFLFVFALAFALLTFGLASQGLDVVTAFSGAATALANVGPGLGEVIGPAGNFASLPDTAKWMLCAGMLMGRLEFITVLALIVPEFWQEW
jgi:trk system potassium uptake protein TrkH